jgi:hypothetical protein
MFKQKLAWRKRSTMNDSSLSAAQAVQEGGDFLSGACTSLVEKPLKALGGAREVRRDVT